MNGKDLVKGLTEERERLAAFLKTIPAEAWSTPSACAGWTVRDVLAHLVGNVADTIAGQLQDAGAVGYNQRQVDERAGKTPDDLLAEWAGTAPKLESFFAGFSDEVWNTVVPQIGMSTREGVQRLLEDLWIHASDIRLPLGAPAEKGPGLVAALETIVELIPARLVAFAPTSATIRLELDDFTAEVPRSGETEVTVAGDPIAFVLVATGRMPIDEATADGRLKVTAQPDGLAEALNIYGAPVPS